ncbi:MAG: tetratricopeptide repeat protein [Rhodothermales bacterium]
MKSKLETRTHFLAMAAVVALVGTLVFLWLKPLPDEPEVAVAPTTPASLFINTDASIAFYEDRIRKAPDDREAYTRLAQVYLQKAHASGEELTYVPLAKERIEQALSRDPDDYYALALQASLFNTLHRFDDARVAAERLQAAYPHDSFIQGVLVDALVELGEYDEAVAANDALLGMHPGLAAYARASYLRELHGDTDGALSAMTMAAQAGVVGEADRAWALTHLANLYLGKGDLEVARRVFEGILEETPGYAQAIAGLGHIAELEGDYAGAVAGLEEAYGLEPRAAFLERLAEIQSVQGASAAAEAYLDRVDASFQEAARMGENNRMEYADFLADRGLRLDHALRLAEAEIARRPGHLHANETYAWVLHRLGRSAEAVAPIEKAMRLDTGDAMVHYRAGQIYRAIGDAAASQLHFQKALDAHLHIESQTAANTARTLLAQP